MNYGLTVTPETKINVVSKLDQYQGLSFGRVCRQIDGQSKYVINEKNINKLPEGGLREYVIGRQRTIRVSVALHHCRHYPPNKDDGDSRLRAVDEQGIFHAERESLMVEGREDVSADIAIDQQNKVDVTVQIDNNVFHDPSIKKKAARDVAESAGYFFTSLIDKLFHAIENGSYEEVVSLYGRCKNVSDSYSLDGNCLHVAARRGDVAILRFILDKNDFDINSQNRNLQTPIFFILRHKDVDLLKLLYEHGARLDYVAGHGETLLHLAVQEANAEIVHFLLAKNVDPNILDDTGNTALHYAVHGRQVEIIQCLINDDRIDFTMTNNDGEHCLHLAVRYRIKEVIRMLIYYAPYLLQKTNSHHELPLHIAISEAMDDVVEILENPVMSLLELSACVVFRHYSLSSLNRQQLPSNLLPYIKTRKS